MIPGKSPGERALQEECRWLEIYRSRRNTYFRVEGTTEEVLRKELRGNRRNRTLTRIPLMDRV